MAINKFQLRNAVDNVYDIQKLRISNGNRLAQSYMQQLGIEPGKKLEDGDEEAINTLAVLKGEYKRITDCYVNDFNSKGYFTKVINKLDKDLQLIRGETDFRLVRIYMDLIKQENEALKVVAHHVEAHPMWDAFFKDVKGCGPLMSGICLAYFDPYKARHCSSFWKYAGLDVVFEEGKTKDEDGKYVGRSMRHTVMQEYTTKDGKLAEKKGLSYNPFVKTKVVGVLGSGFIKCPGSTYEIIYRNYKNRILNSEKYKDYTAGHVHAMSIRYAVKMFLRDFWIAWRKLEGLDITEPYEVAFLGRNAHGYNHADKTEKF